MYVVLVLLQVMLIDNISLGSMGITPMLYVLMVLVLPFEVPQWMQLVFAFALGFSIDVFGDTLGINTASTVTMAFFRPLVLRAVAPRDGYESGTFPYISYFGTSWFTRYALPLILIHHAEYFLLDTFSFAGMFNTFYALFLHRQFLLYLSF